MISLWGWVSEPVCPDGGNLPSTAPALDLDFLLNIIKERRPLDWEAVLKSDVPLKVVASCLDTLQPVILEDFADAQDLETCLRASANVPEVSDFVA